MEHTVVITRPEFEKGRPEFTSQEDLAVRVSPPDEATLARHVRESGSRAVIVGVSPYGGPLYEALGETAGSRDALIARFGVGHETIDKSRARKNGILVTNTPGVLDRSVAEHTVGLVLALARHVASVSADMTSGHWSPREGREIGGKEVAVVGFGAIGRRVSQVLHFGLGAHVTAVDALPPEEMAEQTGTPLDELLTTSGAKRYSTDVMSALPDADIVTLHIPGNAATRHFMNAHRLGRMKSSAFLINTSRGMVLDEVALFDALEAGNLAGAALDVFENEPYVPVAGEKDLRDLDNILLTPHVGSNTREANGRMALASLRNVVTFLNGKLADLNRVT